MRAVLRRLLLVLLAFVSGSASRTEETTPDTSRVLSLIGRFGMAHGCPIGPASAVTAAHVVDVRPWDQGMPLFPYRFSDAAGHVGTATPTAASMREDLAVLRLDVPVQSYDLAPGPPGLGERLWWVGYDWRKKRDALARRVLDGRVLRIVAANVILDEATPEGASGSCVLDSRGRVVAIVAWGKSVGASDEVPIMVGVWPPWLDPWLQTVAE